MQIPSAAVSFYHHHHHRPCQYLHYQYYPHLHYQYYHRHRYQHHHHHHQLFTDAVFYMQIPIAVSFVAAKKVHGLGLLFLTKISCVIF